MTFDVRPLPGVCTLQCGTQRDNLLGCWIEFDLCNHVHTMKCSTSERPCQSEVAVRLFLPPLKLVGFRAYAMSYRRQMTLL
jgi:hypothetical protein